MGQVKEIVDSFCGSLLRAKSFHAPFVHFRGEHLFPENIAHALAARPVSPQSPASGRRELVKDRFYLDPTHCAGDSLLSAVTEAFQTSAIASALGRLCGAALDGTFLRIEYTVDTNGFWLAPHTDLGVKKFTGLIPLSGGEEGGADDLGTDLYRSPDAYFGRASFEPNSGILFVPGLSTWHGFEVRPIKGMRKSLIVNYVGPEWESREQLAFPDRPISL